MQPLPSASQVDGLLLAMASSIQWGSCCTAAELEADMVSQARCWPRAMVPCTCTC